MPRMNGVITKIHNRTQTIVLPAAFASLSRNLCPHLGHDSAVSEQVFPQAGQSRSMIPCGDFFCGG